MKKFIIITMSITMLAGCASHSNEIQTAYVSPMEYQDYTCKQIAAEMGNVTRRANTLAGDIDKRADNDSVKMGVGLVLLWPTLFFLSGDHPNQSEYGELKGRMKALEEANVRKNCGIKVEQQPAVKDAVQQPVKNTSNINN